MFEDLGDKLGVMTLDLNTLKKDHKKVSTGFRVLGLGALHYYSLKPKTLSSECHKFV
jgi:hypothetical protein